MFETQIIMAVFLMPQLKSHIVKNYNVKANMKKGAGHKLYLKIF